MSSIAPFTTSPPDLATVVVVVVAVVVVVIVRAASELRVDCESAARFINRCIPTIRASTEFHFCRETNINLFYGQL